MTIPVIKFLFQKTWASWDTTRIPEDFQEIELALARLHNTPSALVLAAVHTKEDLAAVAMLTIKLRSYSQWEHLRVVVVDFANHRFDRVLAKLHLQEIIDGNIHQKGLKLKMDFWLQSIEYKAQAASPQSKIVTSAAPEVDRLIANAKLSSMICKGEKLYSAALDDLYDHVLSFKLDAEAAEEFLNGDEVGVIVKGKYQQMRFLVQARARVTHKEELEDGSCYITLAMEDAPEELFDEMMSFYQERQKAITRFLETARGVA